MKSPVSLPLVDQRGTGPNLFPGRCERTCGLKDSHPPGWKGRYYPNDHRCVLRDGHDGECAFIGTCGRNRPVT